MMVHMVVPHAHHHHEDQDKIAHSHEEPHHHSHNESHGGAHGHAHDSEKDNNQEAFSFPTEKHLHAFHIHEFVNASKKRNLQLEGKSLPLHANINSANSFYQDKSKQSYSFIFFKRIFYDNPFIGHCSLRAPPETA